MLRWCDEPTMIMIEISPNNKELAVIFVNYRSIFHLSRALRSLERDPFFSQNAQLIIVNQDNTEQKASFALSKQQGCQLISRKNHGFASGANKGASLAEGRYLAFLNPDIQHSIGSFREVADAFRKNAHLGIVGATLLSEGVQEPWSKGQFLTLSRLFWNNVFPGVFRDGERRVDWVSGGALFIKRELFQSLGGFDEKFFLYFEDMDLCERARAVGFSAETTQSLQFSHKGGKSFSSKRSQKKRYADSQRYYFEKHRPFWEQKILSALQYLKIW